MPGGVKRFSDFAEENINLTGDKIGIRDVFGKEILIKAFRIIGSKAAPGKDCAQVQIELDGKEYVVFTTSVVLMRQLRQYAEHMPFLTTIKDMKKYHTFS